ncbi:MAG: PilZ domain-containing protein [Deltaproteobacteria bacterium]|nr:PilZ domain-containing protein [Deltaproteobacteria bacterium]MBW2052962.1 PilZ domain-containing protein [Deltaproteobacteria bacterium]MBW2141555.1 PilZ domain-containing protein [Deltaproteobacteria bacterium]MBW2324500.1 PilZ domain-containing protein [Deltaproteobacteria bacterium]
MDEKRSLERFAFEIPAAVEVISGDKDRESELLNLLTHNICAGGAYFYTEKPLPENTMVTIDLVLSIERLKKIKGKQAYIKVKGQVIRSEPNGMAICFEPDYSIKSI